MPFQISTSPHVHQENTHVSLLMYQVLYALLPGLAIYIWLLGWGVLINILLASLTALVCEAILLRLRNYPLRPFLADGSALVTAWLLGIALSPYVPWWITVVATAFSLIFGKHLYGGLGNNPFNPAMVGYAVMLISFPAEMSRWPSLQHLDPPSLLENLKIIFLVPPFKEFDALSSATPLDAVKTGLKQYYTLQEIQVSPIFGYLAGNKLEWVTFAFLGGGIWLIFRKAITWHIPLTMLGSLFLISGVFFILDTSRYPSPLFHLFAGGSMLGAFFIATDPVTAATSNQGRLFYGTGIGLLTYVIRTWGGYPDGVAFAVLLMNLTAPTIDYLTQPRVLGHHKK